MPDQNDHRTPATSDRPAHRLAAGAASLSISRRTLLVAGGTGLIAAGMSSKLARFLHSLDLTAPDLRVDLIRPDDMLVLHFDLYNLVRSTAGGPPQLEPRDPAQPSYVAVTFGPQHVMEEPLFSSGAEPPLPPAGHLHTAVVAPSQVVFTVPNTVKSLPFSTEGLLSWWEWVMRVAPVALPPNPHGPFPPPLSAPPAPADLWTDLRLVDWLHLSPDQLSTWQHAATPVTRSGRTELWHTRLAHRTDDGRPDPTATGATVRAIWTDARPAGTPFTALTGPTDSTDKFPEQIVKLTTWYDAIGADVVAPVTADLVLLSATGSSVELEGDWRPAADKGVNLLQWQHRSTLGRDNYIRMQQAGFLFPFGNRATRVIETKRVFASNGAAYLIQRQFIIVREQVVNYPAALQPDGGQRFPFRRIELTTRVTPDLPANPSPIEPGSASFWIEYQGAGTATPRLPFPVIATDWEGKRVEFTCTLAFVVNNEAIAPAPVPYEIPPVGAKPLTKLLASYNSYFGLSNTPADSDPGRSIALNGQKVAFRDPATPGDSTYPVTTLFLGAYGSVSPDTAELASQDRPNFYPAMLGAQVRLPAVEALAGAGLISTIAYDPVYAPTVPGLAAGENQADTFARVQQHIENVGDLVRYLEKGDVPAPTDTIRAAFSKASDSVGGVAVPDLDIGALSRSFGPLSGTPDAIKALQQGTFDPADFFPDSANLLGDISLADLIAPLTLAQGGGGPTIVTTLEYPGGDTSQPPQAVVTTFDWKPKVQTPAAGPFIATGVDGRPATLTLHGVTRTVLDGGATTSKVTGDLRDFTLAPVERDGALSFLQLVFNRFTFESTDGGKPQLHVDLARVDFVNELAFVNTLRQFLATAGVGPNLDVQPGGITVGYTLPIPNIAIGVFALQNLSFSAGMTLPFDGRPITARFAFCSREHKFLVSVYVFAGGGYFALELGSDGLRSIEAAVEFGGNLALDIVVASGSVTVMAGIYFTMAVTDDGKDRITLTGYVRATGRLSVLGLITITAEFYLGLTYVNDGGENSVAGEASLTVSIDILFFSTSVTLRVKKTFAGPAQFALSGGAGGRALTADQPGFRDLMTQSDWNTYCDAFAG